jgi:mono/diheme cytochrome c family protein
MVDALYAALNRVGFTDPLHSLLVHVPIGLVVGTLVFFLVAVIFKRKQLVLTARHAAILAFIFVFPTILTGVFDWLHFYKGVLLPAIRMKMILAGAVIVVLGAAIVLGSRIRLHTIPMTVLYALAFVAVAGLGYFGGGIVYGRGAKAAPAALSAKANAGAAVFANSCQACHPGGGNAVDAAYPLKSSKKLADEKSFVSFIRNPLMRDGKPGQMPAFGGDMVSDAEASGLYAYVTAMQSDPAWR